MALVESPCPRHTPTARQCARRRGNMGNTQHGRKWLLVALLLVGGCAKQDADRLAHIAQKSGQKLDRLTGGMRNKVTGGWHAARGSLGAATLDSRVQTRLKRH